MMLEYFVVQVNEGIYLRKITLKSGWFPTFSLKDAEQFMSPDKANDIAAKWGGKVVCCSVEIKPHEVDE
ncbi:hypothetical protein BU586_04575 [Staphylococcus agnetis]|uniref:hypothetical protein n=1 Tax=Staphylococcus agnetis TaxID=985762 RepID=UPI000D1B446A|nr:hypothetical protein [Staphylococcus agnetis]NJH98600.1 hypothetical protein [Staphylococcus agnetis]PTH70407.1 hypothetical protein BU586_04575 [Staphylococcus agnetis]PTH76542.1 hypothetical protein BU579_08550 [Staphylococcus agnetis]